MESLFDSEPDRSPYTDRSTSNPAPLRTPTHWKPATTPHARRLDPAESHQAAASVTRVTEKQQAVMRCLAFAAEPLTDHALLAFYTTHAKQYDWPEQSPSGIRTRRSELAAAGMIVRAGRGILPSGRSAARWTTSHQSGEWTGPLT